MTRWSQRQRCLCVVYPPLVMMSQALVLMDEEQVRTTLLLNRKADLVCAMCIVLHALAVGYNNGDEMKVFVSLIESQV